MDTPEIWAISLMVGFISLALLRFQKSSYQRFVKKGSVFMNKKNEDTSFNLYVIVS
jgi:hypothetical protein